MWRSVVALLAFQCGWWACVLGAANGMPLVGPAAALLVFAVHLAVSDRVAVELWFVPVAALAGYLADSMLAGAGVLQFSGAGPGGLAPLWTACLWLCFATTLNGALAFLHGRRLLAVTLGATSGPVAYLGGQALGALNLAAPVSQSLAWIALEWGVLLPLLSKLGRRVTRRPSVRPTSSPHPAPETRPVLGDPR